MKHPFENHSEKEPRWRRPTLDLRGLTTVTFISSTVGCGLVAWDSKPVHDPAVRCNRWTYETVLILSILTVLSGYVAMLLFALHAWMGGSLTPVVVMSIVVAVRIGSAVRLL